MTLSRDIAAVPAPAWRVPMRGAVARCRVVALALLATCVLIGCATDAPTRAERMLSLQSVDPMHIERDGVVHCRTDDVIELSSAILTLPPDFPDANEHIDANLGIVDGCQRDVSGIYVRTNGMHIVSADDASWLQTHDHRLDVTMGCAVAVADDGYFLTAGHCVDSMTNTSLVCKRVDGELTVSSFRVVWSSNGSPDGASLSDAVRQPDLALIHAQVRPAHVARLAEAGRIAVGASIIGGRFVTTSDIHHERWPFYAGEIAEVYPGVGETGAFALRINAPSCGGDSGGPVILEDGALAAVVSSSFTPLFGPRSTLAWAMPAASLERLIADDRARSANESTTR